MIIPTTKHIWSKLGRYVHWMVVYKICVFGADRKSNMAARAYNVFWLVEILNINKNLVYDHLMNISAKFDSNLFCGFRKKNENVKFP
jgi:hypothetical protein